MAEVNSGQTPAGEKFQEPGFGGMKTQKNKIDSILTFM
jgi:hypothetical protein